MLIVGQLKTKGSYAKDIEYPADEHFDTCQFFFDADSLWRIRTFAVDHDIHIHRVEGEGDATSKAEFAREHLESTYGDILARILTLDADTATPDLALNARLAAQSLQGHVVKTPHGFLFWNPDDAAYRTQSTPDR